ncbi:MAG: DegT/DnrJ/EryC1/StrS family aminotransferase [Candidatus Omnitrophica bacterium]|nr:DegT/DnrJ/EryC1/StrS family aminotransferase [Candidatus Omnitrophota bacterium]
MKIPILDLKKQYKGLKKEIEARISKICDNQSFVLGEEVSLIEKNISEYCNTQYAIGVNSGTDALILALNAMGICKGDEVITTPFTFVATVEAISLVGGKPVFVDIDPKTYNIDPGLVEAKITEKTKAIVPVHLYGLCADMDPISSIAKKHKLPVLEDCAQAIGSTYKGKKAGSLGVAGAISFYPGKNLGCFGDGGMVVTNEEALYKKVKLLRNHGSEKSYYHKIVGYNSRLDNLQAAVLNIKLTYLDKWIDQRIENAAFFNKNLAGCSITTPHVPEGYRHSYHQYVLRSKDAGKIVKHLLDSGIESRTYYPLPLHLQECFKSLGHKPGDFPESEKLSKESFAIPVYPELTKEEKDYIVATIKKV